jgi:hypothetical protein
MASVVLLVRHRKFTRNEAVLGNQLLSAFAFIISDKYLPKEVRFQILTAASMKMAVFWVVPCVW